MENLQSEFLVIEETSPVSFVKALETASQAGFMVVSSNLSPSHYEGELLYYALMSKKSQRSGLREIPVLNI